MIRQIALAFLLLAAPPTLAQAQGKPAATSRFLQPGDLDPALVLPPPPKDDDPAAVEGRAELHRIAAARTPERLAQAKADDELEDVRAIAAPLGPAFSLERFPATAKLFADLRSEDSVAAKRAKAYFKRERPFFYDHALDVCDDAHDTMAWSASAVLANLMPGNAQVILAHTSDYVESRLVCGVHYRSDLEAGHVLGTALVARLMTKPAFAAEVDAARAELTAAHIAP
jgi:acid phosphatase (class A)